MSKIFFWASGTTDACTFYRMSEPARVLRARGHLTRCDHAAGLADLMTADVVVIQRPTEAPPQEAMQRLLSIPERHRPRVVVELDDDLFAIPEHNPAGQLLDAQRERLRWAIAHADRVTVTNAHLAQQIAGDSCPPEVTAQMVRVVPNYVPERFVVDRVPELGAVGTPTITWAGSDTHRRDFDEVAVPLRKLLRERTDFRVRIVGAPYAARLWTSITGPDLPPNRVTQVPWVEGVDRYIPTLAGHIGLAPLADDLFNRSKSDLRLKELAARGMAVLASDVGPYADSDVPRLPVRGTPHFRWEVQLEHLLDSAGETEAHAVRALDWAKANTLEAHAGEWEAALLDD